MVRALGVASVVMMAQSAPDMRVLRLRNLDACAVSDALDQLRLSGVVTGIPQRSGKGCIAGRAVTVKLGVGVRDPLAAPVHLGCTAVESAGPDNVIVIEQRSGVDAGSWGGLLSLGAKARGIAGAIVDGPVRDIDEAIGYAFPVFCTQLTSFTARGRIIELGNAVPVQIGSVVVTPGDYVLADQSAVIFIAANQIDAVLTAAEAIAAKEAAMASAIAAGTPISSVMGGNYENMLKGSTHDP